MKRKRTSKILYTFIFIVSLLVLITVIPGHVFSPFEKSEATEKGATTTNEENDKSTVTGTTSTVTTAPQTTLEKDPVKELLSKMSLEEKIGQMIITGIEGTNLSDSTINIIQDYHIGGCVLFGYNISGTEQLLDLINSLKTTNSKNKVPLFVSVDEEGGIVSRMPIEIVDFPPAMDIGKVGVKEFSYEIGLMLSEALKEFGFNMNFAPVLDINSNPDNPVIGSRAFGIEVETVSVHGIEVMKGLQDGGTIPVLKHFPGHGDTSTDSHLDLPQINHEANRIYNFELVPFEKAFYKGADAVMIAHILVNALDSKNPATLSEAVITDLLRERMKFDGVVITDDMNMGAITNYYGAGEAAVKSIKAGTDIVLICHSADKTVRAFNAIKDAVSKGEISEERINLSVERILRLKTKYGLSDMEKESLDIEKLNSEIKKVLNKFPY